MRNCALSGAPFLLAPPPPLFLDLQPPLGPDELFLALWVVFATSFWKFKELFLKGGEKIEGRRNLSIMGVVWEQIPSIWELKWSRLSRCQRVPLSSEGSVGLRGSPCQSPWASSPVSSEQFHFNQIQFQMNIEFVATKEALENLWFGSTQALTFKETECWSRTGGLRS